MYKELQLKMSISGIENNFGTFGKCEVTESKFARNRLYAPRGGLQ